MANQAFSFDHWLPVSLPGTANALVFKKSDSLAPPSSSV
jgi:hypothetical protein